MPRPRKDKCIDFEPTATYFKPRGLPLRELEKSDIDMEELEALRLAYVEDLSQADAAARMGVHQSTFHRILARANKKVAEALVKGRAIRIMR